MTLRPGCAPARLLLELWRRQADGTRWVILIDNNPARRLLELGYVQLDSLSACHVLTQAGRYAAQTLEAGSR